MQSSDDVAAAVGRNVRALRQQRRMTIDALAAASGVSRGTVIQVETARGNPSIATLCNLASALRVGVASLVDGDAAPRLTVRRAEQAVPLWSSPAGSSAVFRIGTDPPDVVELWDWTLQPGDSFEGEAHPMGTVEVLSVLAGTLGLRTGEVGVPRGERWNRRRRAGTGDRRHRDVRGPRRAPLRLRRSPTGALHDGRAAAG